MNYTELKQLGFYRVQLQDKEHFNKFGVNRFQLINVIKRTPDVIVSIEYDSATMRTELIKTTPAGAVIYRNQLFNINEVKQILKKYYHGKSN